MNRKLRIKALELAIESAKIDSAMGRPNSADIVERALIKMTAKGGHEIILETPIKPDI